MTGIDSDVLTPDEHLAGLRAAMDAQTARVDPATASLVRAALEYGVEVTRSEYRALAERNWHEIRRWSKRTFALMVLLVLSLALLGYQSVKTTDEIQQSRRDRITTQCENGNAFVRQLEADIAREPPAERAKSEATLPEVVGLVRALVPFVSDCTKAVGEAGL